MKKRRAPMPPKNKTEPGVDVHASDPLQAGGINHLICRAIGKGGSVMAIVPAGFMPKPGVVLANQPLGAVDLYRIFWIEPHEEPPKMPGTGELRIRNNGL